MARIPAKVVSEVQKHLKVADKLCDALSEAWDLYSESDFTDEVLDKALSEAIDDACNALAALKKVKERLDELRTKGES